MMTPNEIDPETGGTHLVAAAWRILAALQLQQEAIAEHELDVFMEDQTGFDEGESVPIEEAFILTREPRNQDFTFVTDVYTTNEIGDKIYSAERDQWGIIKEIDKMLYMGKLQYTITATPVETTP